MWCIIDAEWNADDSICGLKSATICRLCMTKKMPWQTVCGSKPLELRRTCNYVSAVFFHVDFCCIFVAPLTIVRISKKKNTIQRTHWRIDWKQFTAWGHGISCRPSLDQDRHKCLLQTTRSLSTISVWQHKKETRKYNRFKRYNRFNKDYYKSAPALTH